MRHRFMFSTKTKLRNPKLNTQSLKKKSKQNKTSFPSHSAEPKKKGSSFNRPFCFSPWPIIGFIGVPCASTYRGSWLGNKGDERRPLVQIHAVERVSDGRNRG
ncbi:hypothetical protein V6Z11_A01G062600 [Gossypium hirsutum]